VIPGNWWRLEPLENLKNEESFALDITYADIDTHVDSLYSDMGNTLGTIGPIIPVTPEDNNDPTAPPNTNTFQMPFTTEQIKGFMTLGSEPIGAWRYNENGFGRVGDPKLIGDRWYWDVSIDIQASQYGIATYEVRIN
jgi:hypothetical protein